MLAVPLAETIFSRYLHGVLPDLLQVFVQMSTLSEAFMIIPLRNETVN